MLANAFLRAEGIAEQSFGDHIMTKAFEPLDLIKAADAKLTERRESPIPDLSTIYRVSGLSKLCPMEEYLRHKGQVSHFETISPILKKTFDFGHGFHSVVQNTWFGPWGWLVGDWRCKACGDKKLNTTMPKICHNNLKEKIYTSGNVIDSNFICSGKEFEYIELSLESKDHFLTGHPDGILRLDGHDYVVELKSANSKWYNWIDQKRQPHDAHRDQINLYMFLLKKQHGIILYFNKDESQWMQFYESIDESRVKKLLEKITVAKASIKEDKPPYKHRVCTSKTCARAKLCPVRATCFS